MYQLSCDITKYPKTWLLKTTSVAVGQEFRGGGQGDIQDINHLEA
jgi:hypothetical protein